MSKLFKCEDGMVTGVLLAAVSRLASIAFILEFGKIFRGIE